jgi:hypothetical protein
MFRERQATTRYVSFTTSFLFPGFARFVHIAKLFHVRWEGVMIAYFP